jgi:hypothetical protein
VNVTRGPSTRTQPVRRCVSIPSENGGRPFGRPLNASRRWPVLHTMGRAVGFVRAVAQPNASLNAETTGQVFLVGLVHSQLQAGLSRRFRCHL